MDRSAFVFILVLLGTGVAAGCAPSLRMVHQSNVYFERCHSADYDPTIQSDIRRDCWAAWLEHYTPGQPPERIEYARRRVRALDEGITVPPLPGLPSAALGLSYTTSFLVTSTSTSTDSRVSEGEEVLPSSIPPVVTENPVTEGADAPTRICAPERLRCREACNSPGCHEACSAEYRTCLGGLY